MMKKYALVLVALAVSASVAGCTVSEASDRDQYGSYLTELNSGNAAFNYGRTQYDVAMHAFTGGVNYDAMNAMSDASGYYSVAMGHYDQMSGYAGSPDQKAYASALKSYAQSCMYAAAAYLQAYRAYDAGDRTQGDARMREATAFVTQANEYHDKAVKLQSMAIT